MEIVKYLFLNFFEENLHETIFLIILSLTGNILHTNVITYFNSALQTSVQDNAFDKSVVFFKYFMYSRLFLALFNYGYKLTQDVILTKLKQWMRFNLLDVIFKTNNENISNINFTKLSTPINRLSSTCYLIISDLLNYTLPYLMFVLVTMGYFVYQNRTIGIIFILGNLLWMTLMYYMWDIMWNRSNNYERSNLFFEKHLIEVLNNIDKIFTRGQKGVETNIFSKEAKQTEEAHRDYYYSVSTAKFMVELITLLTMFICTGYAIHLYMEGKMDAIQFVSIFTLLMVFKERMNSCASLASDSIEQLSRLDAVIEPFQSFEDRVKTIKKQYQNQKLDFKKFDFKKVWFRYNKDLDYVFEDKDLDFTCDNHKIIGITGESGKGKSSILKIILKLHLIEKGEITIDGTDLKDIDPDYIRDNITYINQNSRLFDKTVLENILYGCKDEDTCRDLYKKILSYPRIKNLYKNVDLNNDTAGYSGEKLSGGQRQIVNIISGLVNPSKILILDEPTNALDKDLKMELLEIIKYFKPYKQSIIIITHDKDVYDIFDEKIEM
jgi:ABC-type bacteriocin/lantibiotic exporter with double-glycine peptidase domain